MEIKFSLVVILLLIGHFLPVAVVQGGPPPHGEPIANTHWQLFLDDYVIERSTGFQRVVHHPTP